MCRCEVEVTNDDDHVVFWDIGDFGVDRIVEAVVVLLQTVKCDVRACFG
jgi:hypothetical protein